MINAAAVAATTSQFEKDGRRKIEREESLGKLVAICTKWWEEYLLSISFLTLKTFFFFFLFFRF